MDLQEVRPDTMIPTTLHHQVRVLAKVEVEVVVVVVVVVVDGSR